MSFYLEEECEVPFSFDYEQLGRKVVDACLEKEAFPYEAEVNLTLTDNLNRINICRVKRENTLYANTVGNTANCECF